MASFNITGPITVGQALINSETGIVGSNGSIQVTSGSAVTLSDNSGVLVAGDLLASAGAGIRGVNLNRTNIAITEGANIVTTGSGSSAHTALYLPVGDLLRLTSAGNIQSAFRGIDVLTSNNDARLELILSGRITTADEAVQVLATGAGSQIDVVHSGDILSNFDAVELLGGSATDIFLGNSGLIEGKTGGVRVSTANEIIVNNSGTITGDGFSLNLTGTVATSMVDNSGDLIGLVDMSDGADVLRNSGLIDGDVLLGAGDDVFNTRWGTTTGDITTGDGNDVVRGSQGNDDIDGQNDDDEIHGYGGDDMLLGGAGFDTIRGGSGDDEIDGGGRSDLLIGGKGDDTITGAGGDDTFVMRRVGNGDDEVTDFQDGSDVVDLTGLGLQNFNKFDQTGAMSNDFDAVVIDLALAGGSGSLRLVGVQVADMDATDFLF
ncbi:MAG: hypothetical protein AAFP87_18290 [Pseudomonadota bacterium]